ncbi:hypothetical protein Misp01_48580 [Microtetraspora sp. NBRC 13810]|uniref:hypothetical protein n=1 Tax=Microtetraspora sp. NBRC 13810 TaxID=3030990 RepID=UPI0024A1A792|nr:hypothetical protein [Microtetraspora sp. NBRC 13810]GLW09729.1 hypothetical protein Misp01_48580 [Microtetraspora sp. NBRC 13810]
MLKLRHVLAGTVLAGALAAGVVAVPAQAATAGSASAAQVQSTKHWFEGYSSFGRGEHRNERSYYKGYWYFSDGRYHFDLNAWDRDRDRESTYVEFWYHDDRGWHLGRRFSTRGHDEWKFSYSRKGGFDGFRVRIGEGGSRDLDWNKYYNRSF